MITWRGSLRFRTSKTGKLVKYGILVRTVCEATTGCIGNMEICTGGSKRLEETKFSLLETYLGQWHHVYQDNYYNSVEIAKKLLLRKKRVCRTTRHNQMIPKSLADYSKKLKRTFFCTSGRIRWRFA
jgi:hypothetical protein